MHEQVVRVVVVFATFADGADSRYVHQPLQLLDSFRVSRLAFLRRDAERRAHPFRLRLPVHGEEFDDPARDLRQATGANVLEMIVGIARAAEGRVEDLPHLDRNESRLLDEGLSVVETLLLRELVVTSLHALPFSAVVAKCGDGESP